MKTYTENYAGLEKAASKEPRYVVQISWDKADTDFTYLTSSDEAQTPYGADVIDSCVLNISGQTQKINPDIATSTIGSVSVELSDATGSENFFLWSEDVTQVPPWINNAPITITADSAFAPDGEFTADEIDDTSAVLGGGINEQIITVADDILTRTVGRYYKKGTSNETFVNAIYTGGAGVSNGAIIDWSTTPPTANNGEFIHVGDGWYLHTMLITNNGGGNTFLRHQTYPAGLALPNTGSVFVWGLFGYVGREVNKYVKTTSAAIAGVGPQITNAINSRLESGNGLRGKVVRVYVGYGLMPFSDYDLRLTYIIDSITYMDGRYVINMSDVQRSSRHKIFSPQETTLNSSIDDTSLIVPVTSSDESLFPSVTHGAAWSVRPFETVGYIKIEDEVICHTGNISFDTINGWHITALERGALNTRNVVHEVSSDTEDNRKPKITEHIYLEGPSAKVIVALYTGLLHSYENRLLEPFDFTTWETPIGTPVVAATTDNTPVGWGPAYSVTDDDVGIDERIRQSVASGYVHGDIWNASLFVKKEASSFDMLLRLEFTGGAAASRADLVFDPSTGAASTATSAVTVNSFEAIDFDSEWWYLRISGNTTTTGTTGAMIGIHPRSLSAGTGSVTVFGASMTTGLNVGMTALPIHWHLEVDESFVRLSDFQSLGVDMWNTDTDAGRRVRIENPGSQDGKRYIEKEMLLWMGCFMPIYSTGELGIKKLSGVLSDSAYQATLDKFNVVSYGTMTHDMRSVINDIRLSWNWVDLKEEFTKENIFIDSNSIDKHGSADSKAFSFKAVHTGLHTDEDLLTYFDVLRDRYSGPPLLLSLSVLPSMSRLEVGDVVRVQLEQIRDFNNNASLDRAFEVQQVTTNWMTGAISLKLFGSSQRAGELIRTTLASVLDDSYYDSIGTELSTVLTIVAGAVTVSGSLTGHASDIDNAGAVYYYLGDLTINAGVVVTISENVQLRVRGSLLINGDINGIGNGATGGAATSQFVGGGTSDFVSVLWSPPYDPAKDIDYDHGEQGYFGTTLASAVLSFQSVSLAGTLEGKDGIGKGGVVFETYLSGLTALGDVGSTISRGIVDVMPFFQLTNDQQTARITGYSKDLRGNSGVGGIPLIKGARTIGVGQTNYILGNGGVGGNGGAGLLIVGRGMAFGVAGKIDLSGGDSSAGAGVTEATTSKQFYAGSGAPGAPGALLILLDGQVTNPDVSESKFIANYGSVGYAVNTTLVQRDVDRSTSPDTAGIVETITNQFGTYSATFTIAGGGTPSRPWPTIWPNAVYSGPDDVATQDISVFGAAHRIQYIPEDETPIFRDGDDSLFKPLNEYEYTETNLIQILPATANDTIGQDTSVTDDGTRLVASGKSRTGGAVGEFHVLRNIDNFTLEQTVADPTAIVSTQFGINVEISQEGDRLYAAAPGSTVGPTAISGLVYVYTRSGLLWSVEQILQSVAPTNSSQFGLFLSWNRSHNKMLVMNIQITPSRPSVEYFDRVGTVWTSRGVVASGGTVGGTLCEISPSGEYALFGLSTAAIDGVFNAGEALVYLRSGTTWTQVASLTPDLTTLAWGGLGGSLDWDATTIVFATAAGNGKVAVYRREGAAYKLIQILENPTVHGSGTFGSSVELSKNGLTLMAHDFTNEEVFVFKRSDTNQAFSSFQTIKHTDVGTLLAAQSINLSDSGKILTVGNWLSDVGANNAGAVYVWKTLAS